MDIHKFEVFLGLAGTMNFTKTTERQFTARGNISKQILPLETEPDARLFECTHRKIRLAEAGSLLLLYIEDVVGQCHAIQEVLETYIQENNLSLNVLTISTMINCQGFPKIIEFLKHYPESTVQLKEVENIELTYGDTNEHDDTIHFVRSFQAPPNSIRWLPTETDDFVAVLPKTHPLAAKKKLDLSRLKKGNFLVLSPTMNLYQPVLDLCREAGFEPRISCKGSRVDLIINMIANDMGIAIVMEKTVRSLLKENIVILPISPTKEGYLAFTRKIGEHSLASDTFWEYLR